MNPMSLVGKKIVISGGASGIGRELAILASKLGAGILLLDINEEGLQQTAAECRSTDVVCKVCDVTDEAQIEAAFQEGTAFLGKLSGLVHCAGIPSIVPLRVLGTEDFERVNRVNTEAAMLLVKYFSKKKFHHAEQRCSIVLISSAVKDLSVLMRYKQLNVHVSSSRHISPSMFSSQVEVRICILTSYIMYDPSFQKNESLMTLS